MKEITDDQGIQELRIKHKQREKRIAQLIKTAQNSPEILDCLSYEELIRPLVLIDSSKGLSQNQLAIKYGIALYQVQWIVENFKH